MGTVKRGTGVELQCKNILLLALCLELSSFSGPK